MSMAIILAHPNMTAASAIEVARRDGLLLIHTKRGNYRYESSTASMHTVPPAHLPAESVAGAVAGPEPEAA